tara:strand:- start:5135 stop:5620 length:486 start_codon:yes stop_codon:yes gene_type:complete
MAQHSDILTMLKAELADQFGTTGVDLFNQLNVSDWGAFFRIGERLVFEQNSIILKAGQVGDAIYFLTHGQVRIEHKIDKERIQLALLDSGCIFGEMAFLDGDEVSADVIADSHVEVIQVTYRDLDNLMEEDGQFSCHFYQSLAVTLSRRLRATNKIVSQFD